MRDRAGPRPASAPDPVRLAALRILIDVERDRFPATERLSRDESRFTRDEDRRLLHALVLETLRHRAALDAALEARLLHRALDELDPPARNALRLGLAQLTLLDRMSVHAAVDTAVAVARHCGHAGTAAVTNAVLRRLSREVTRLAHAGTRGEAALSRLLASTPIESAPVGPVAALARRYSTPEWIVARWLSRWGEARAEAALRASAERPEYWIRLRPGASLPADARPGWIPGTGLLPAGSQPGQHPAFQRGEFLVQDGAGILVGHLPPVVRGLVLDVCAAPGTKTTALVDRAEPGTRVLASDRSMARLRKLLAAPTVSEERGAHDASLHRVVADAAQLPFRTGWDGVLVDAPCSNLGVLRRRVDLRWRAREEEIARLAVLQTSLLDEAARGLAPGGWLVYSVCTPEPEEGVEQYERFFARHPEFEARALPEVVPEAARGRIGEMILVPGEFGTDGGYAFLAVRRST